MPRRPGSVNREFRAPSNDWVWNHRSLTHAEMGIKLGGASEWQVRAALRKYGYRRSAARGGQKGGKAGEWARVPCRLCGELMAVIRRDHWICGVCDGTAQHVEAVELPEWKQHYDRELARVLAKQDAAKRGNAALKRIKTHRPTVVEILLYLRRERAA